MDKLLKDKRVYFSSPMENANSIPDWKAQRENVKKHLKKIYELKVFDPYDDPKQAQIKDLDRDGTDYDAAARILKSYVKIDLNCVDRSDIVIAYVNRSIPTAGTHHEIINANLGKKLVLLVSGTKKFDIPLWYFGFIDHRYMFGTWDEMYDFLDQVDNGAVDLSRVWMLQNYPVEWLS